MNYDILPKLRQLRMTDQLAALCTISAIIILVGFAVVNGGSRDITAGKTTDIDTASAKTSADKTAESNSHTKPATKPGADPAALASSASKSAVVNASLAASPGAPTTAVLKTTTNRDGTTTKEVATYTSIPFATQTQNEVNLKRGLTQVLPGQNGTQTTVYSVVYDQDGKEVSRKIISDSVTRQPAAQITKIGVSDFNLNTDTFDSMEAGVICVPAEYGAGGDGCSLVPSELSFSAVQISGTFYVHCVIDLATTCGYGTVNLQPAAAIRGDGTFIYQGLTYRADPRKGGGVTEPLTPALCAQYGLACGSW
jgi:hypothetical protein